MSTNGVNSVAAQRANLLSAVQNAKTDGERFAAEKQLAMFDLQHKEDYTAIGKAPEKADGATADDRQKVQQKNLDEIGKAKAQAKVFEQYHDLTYQLSQAVINGQDDVRTEVEAKLKELIAQHPELKTSNREELQKVSDKVTADAAKLRETSYIKDSKAGISATFYGNAEDAWQTANIELDAPTEKKTIRSKDQIRHEIKSDAHYVKDDGTVVKGTKDLKANRKGLKADKKAAEKEYKAAAKAFNEKTNRTQEDVDNLIAAFEKYRDANMDYELGNRVYKTAKGNGTRKRARAIRKNDISDNRVVDRSNVYTSKKLADEAVKSGKVGKDHVGYVTEDGLKILTMLKTIAENHQKGVKTSFDEVFTDDNWGALSRIQIPTDKMTAEENEAATRANQTALRTLAGGGNRIEPTEKETLIKELKNAGLKDISRTDINKLYTAYGMEHENRFGNKVKDGLKAAAPVAVAEGLATAYRYKHSASARSTSDATSTATSTATASKTVHYSAEDIQTVTAEAVVNDYIDLGELLGDEQYFGDGIEISASDVKTATAHAKVEGSVTATATATAIAVAKAHSEAFAKAVVKNPWLPGVVTTAAAFGAGFATSKGYESGVTKGAVKEFKRAEFLNLFKGTAAKGAAAEVIQTLDEVAKKTGDRAFADRIGDEAYKKFQGGQNQVLIQRELEGMNEGLKAILESWPKEKPKAPTPEITVTTPAPTECAVDLDTKRRTYPHTRRAGDTWAGLVKAFYPDCLPENGGQHKLSDCIRELKRQLAYDEDGNFNDATFKALLRGRDIPKELLLPEKIFDCDYTKGEVKAEKIVRGGRRGKVLDNAGRGYTDYYKQDCKDPEPVRIDKDEYDRLRDKK